MNTNYQYIPAEEVYGKLKSSDPIHLIDVRSQGEFSDGHARGAKLLPLDELNIDSLQEKIEAKEFGHHVIYLMCQSGARAELAARKLEQYGLKNFAIVSGGTDAWRTGNLPMVKTSKLPSLERQTQIALGILLLLILFKGFVLHPIFHALIALLAIGLITAGVTARCSLTALLARMPWNQPHTNSAA